MGKNVVQCGGTGTGQIAKICNNLLLGISMMGVSEAMALGAALGIDPAVLAGIINTSTGRCWLGRIQPVSRRERHRAGRARYAGGFAANLMLKDLGRDRSGAQRPPAGVDGRARAAALSVDEPAAGTLDFSACVKLYEAQPA